MMVIGNIKIHKSNHNVGVGDNYQCSSSRFPLVAVDESAPETLFFYEGPYTTRLQVAGRLAMACFFLQSAGM